MRHIFKLALVFAVTASLVVGCDRKASTKTTETKSGPGGQTTTTVEKTVESSGNNPPPNSSGETVPPKNP